MLATIVLLMTSCMALTHVVGTGAQTGVKVEKKQWYALWGLVPINEVDSKTMAGGSSDYTIKTQVKFIDYVITAFTGAVSITVQSVEVQK